LRILFDWLVTVHVIATNPANAVRGMKHSMKKGRTTVLSAPKGAFFRTATDRSAKPLIGNALRQEDACRMIRRRAVDAASARDRRRGLSGPAAFSR
jgi:hypothetical protein